MRKTVLCGRSCRNTLALLTVAHTVQMWRVPAHCHLWASRTDGRAPQTLARCSMVQGLMARRRRTEFSRAVQAHQCPAFFAADDLWLTRYSQPSPSLPTLYRANQCKWFRALPKKSAKKLSMLAHTQGRSDATIHTIRVWCGQAVSRIARLKAMPAVRWWRSSLWRFVFTARKKAQKHACMAYPCPHTTSLTGSCWPALVGKPSNCAFQSLASCPLAELPPLRGEKGGGAQEWRNCTVAGEIAL